MANSIPADFLSLGYKNGRIPDCALSSVNGAPNIKLHPQAAEQLGRLIEQAQREKISFSIGSAYRTFDSQVQVKYKQGRGAASPGKSNHGWGTTIDIAELYQLAVTTADSMNTTLPAGQKVDRFSPAVHEKIRQIPNGLYQWLSRNAPKYGWVNPEWAKDGVGSIDECWHWEYQVWPRRPDYVTVIPTIQPVTLRCGEDTPIRTRYARIPSGKTPPTSSITPNIGSLESFHPNIQYELTRRRIATNTAHTYMPFVKLTSLTRVLSSNLPTGTGTAWCPSLGPHGEPNISFDEIYLPKDNRSIIGYAITDANNQSSYTSTQERVRVIVSQSIGDQSQIPMPGIVEVTAERGTAGPMGVRGGLLRAKLKIVAYSVNQINGLLRYFLRPATRVVLELGRRSSDNSEPFTPYNWEQTEKEIIEEFTSLILNPEAQTKFIEDYVYQNNGNYEIFIGYVVKFNLKYNKNNVYEIELDVHSVQQFEIPTIQTGVKSLCADAVDKCRAMDIREYFDEAYAWKPNSFKKLMSREEQLSSAPDGQKSSYEWADDFIAIRNPTTEDSGPGSGEAGLDENEYFVSWRFFVEKILNDPDNGILSVIPGNQRSTDTATPTSLTTTELLRLGLLRPVKPLTDEELKQNNTSLVANEVGYHPDLRSTDPNVMIIYNKTAQLRRNEDDKRNYTNLINASITSQEEKTQFYDNSHIIQWIEGSGIGDFRGSTAQETNQAASGLLSNGVWLNTKAIKQAFMSTDTVTSAIDLLLSMMNAATQGYWNLQLYSNDRQHSGLFVIDMGLSKKLSNTTNTKDTNSSILTIDETENILDSITGININRYRKSDDPIGKNRPKHIYMFNRGTKLLNDGELGSDLIDLNVDFNLPQVIAVQAIAGIGGPAQKGTLETIDIEELNSISLIKNLFATCKDSDICVEQTCDDDDLVSLENKWRQIEEEGTGPSRDVASQEIARQIIQRTYGNVMVIDTVRQLSDLGTALDYIEFNPARMIRKMNLDSRNAEATDAAGNPAPRIVPVAHAFNSSNLTKTTVSLTLPGIGGIELFQSFLVDRVPSILRSGFYLVTKVIHKFSTSNGWTTTLEGRFRYRPAAENSSATKYSAECEPTTTVTSTTSATELRDRATRIAQRRTNYANRIANLSAGTLRQEFDLLENLVERPRFASIAQVEQWERRLNSGQVDIQREEFELVKAEIRKRNALGIQARQGIPEEFRSISDRRLTPKQWPAEGSGAGASF